MTPFVVVLKVPQVLEVPEVQCRWCERCRCRATEPAALRHPLH